MKYPKEVRTYCPNCNSHQLQKVRITSKGRARSMAVGNRKHAASLLGHGGKRAGEKTVKKQGKRQKVTYECQGCKKKHERVIGGRTTKKLEIKA